MCNGCGTKPAASSSSSWLPPLSPQVQPASTPEEPPRAEFPWHMLVLLLAALWLVHWANN